jgi:ADP-L-glycero-D-manno-heptose 6-epimerase
MIIVTGANGFIGSRLVHELMKVGAKDILAVDLVSLEQRPRPLANTLVKKVMHPFAFLQLCEDPKFTEQIEVIFHMGAISSTTETNWQKLKGNNIDFSIAVSNVAARCNCPLIYASSAAVYGQGELGFSDQHDTQTFKPLNLYGKSKQEFDLWMLNEKNTKTKTWYGLRFFNVYGHDEFHKDDMASVVSKAFFQVRNNRSLKLFKSANPEYKDGEQKRDFVYVLDLTKWMIDLWANAKSGKPKIVSGIYNQGFGTARTWLDLAECVFRELDVPMKIDWLETPENIRSQYQYFTEADMNHFFENGGAKPTFDLANGIHDYIQNYLSKSHL